MDFVEPLPIIRVHDQYSIPFSQQTLQMLQMLGVLEVQAAKLRRDALQMLLGTIFGTATSNLWKLLEHYFGIVEDPDKEKAAEASSLINLLKA